MSMQPFSTEGAVKWVLFSMELDFVGNLDEGDKVSNLLGSAQCDEVGWMAVTSAEIPGQRRESVFIYRKKWQPKEMCWEQWKPSSGCFICRWESFLVLSSLLSLPLTFQLTWKWDKLFESFSSSAEVPGANPFWRASLCTCTSFEVTPLSSA